MENSPRSREELQPRHQERRVGEGAILRAAVRIEEARACGRDAAAIPVSIALTLGTSTSRRAALGTDAAEVARNARAYAALGVETLVISAGTVDVTGARGALEVIRDAGLA
jgi:hypothetical protein